MSHPQARLDQLVIEELIDETIIYDPSSKKAHSLNSSAVWIWRQCDGSKDTEHIALEFERTFGSQNAVDLVLSGLQQLEGAGLLMPETSRDDVPQPLITRRAVVGAGSVLMPAIASIVVPSAAAAKSIFYPKIPHKDKPHLQVERDH